MNVAEPGLSQSLVDDRAHSRDRGGKIDMNVRRCAIRLGECFPVRAAQPRPMDFDGRVFRKPGGVAPQMEWNPQSGQMTVVLYFGTRPALRVPLRSVPQFSTDPWAA